MGQKVNPIGLRVGINRTWDSRWYADDANFAKTLHEDLEIKKYVKKKLFQAGISRVVIERPAKRARITIYSARPGVIIGKKGADIEKLRGDLSKMTGSDVHLNIVEVRKPELDAKLVAENIANQLERRIAFRRAMKRAVQNAMRLGALGIRVTAVLAVQKSPGPNGTAKAAFRCTRCGLTWTTAPPKLPPPTASAVSRFGSSRAKSWPTIPWPRTSALQIRVVRPVVVQERKGLKNNA